jgi:bifunctional DNase/RNase
MEMREAEIWTITRTDQGNAVFLRPLGSDLVVPVFIGQLEVQAILTGAGEVRPSRPLTHDLFLSVLRQTGLFLHRVEVHALRDNIFYARLVILGGGFSEKKPLVLDARPSDAFALTVRQKCPIYISRRVLEQSGLPADFMLEKTKKPEEPGGISGAPAARPGRRRELLEELKRAVDVEEYERAAEIRDILILMDQDGKDPEP